MEKTKYRTANPFEREFGYHRAVRKGGFIFTAGTTSIDPETQEIQYPGDAEKQAQCAFELALKGVTALGGRAEDVCRVRMFIADAKDSAAIGKVMKGFFGGDEKGMGVAATMLTSGFVDPGMLVEVELDAVVG